MKSGIFVCALVVLACQVALCFGSPELVGKCQLKDIPENLRDNCIRAECSEKEDGTFDISMLGCPLEQCGRNGEGTWTKADNSKTYPDCCPRLDCP